jgi:hypothetical protein
MLNRISHYPKLGLITIYTPFEEISGEGTCLNVIRRQQGM